MKNMFLGLFMLSGIINAQNSDERTLHFPQQTVYVDSLPPQENVWVFIMAGQSNMAGRGFVESGDTIPDAQIITINERNQWIIAKEPLHFYQPKMTGLDCGMSFARELTKHLNSNITIALLPCAVGGSSIDYWLNDSLFNGINLKSNFMEKVDLAKKHGIIKGIIWHQGESDAFPDKIPVYYEKLNNLVSFFRDYTGNPNLPIILGELGSYPVSENMKTNWELINNIIRRVTHEDENAFLVKTNHLKAGNDNIHFNSKSLRLLGKKYSRVYLKTM